MKRLFSVVIFSVLVGSALLAAPPAHASGPGFTADVTISSTNPDLTFIDSDGEVWNLEVDEPFAKAWSVSHTGGNTYPLVIEFGAPSYALSLDAAGKVGMGVSLPIQDLEIYDPDGNGIADLGLTVAVGGYASWEVRADSTGFAIADMTSTLEPTFPVKILQGTPSDTLVLEPTRVRISAPAVQISSRASKTEIAAAEPAEILRAVIDLPLSEWRYHGEPAGVRHLGPMAEDFQAAFGLGGDPESIPLLDLTGVALAAVQGLAAERAESEARLAAEVEELRRVVDELRARLDAPPRTCTGCRRPI